MEVVVASLVVVCGALAAAVALWRRGARRPAPGTPAASLVQPEPPPGDLPGGRSPAVADAGDCSGELCRQVRQVLAELAPSIGDGRTQIKRIASIPGDSLRLAMDLPAQHAAAIWEEVAACQPRLGEAFPDMRIELVRWHDDAGQRVRSALSGIGAEQVLVCEPVQRAIVLTSDDAPLPSGLALTRELRLAEDICGLEIVLMTADELERDIATALDDWAGLDDAHPGLAEQLVGEGCLYARDLPRLGAARLSELASMPLDAAAQLVARFAAEAAVVE